VPGANTLRGNWAAVLACGAIALAQAASAQQTPGQSAPGQTGGSGNSGTNNSGIPRGLSGGTSRGGTRAQGSGVDGTLYGRVVLSDGAEPDGRVSVQRVCGQTVNGQATTDSSGHFTIPRADRSSFAAEGSGSSNDASAFGCELRASLAGYRSDPLPLGDRRSGDSSDAVVMVLRRVGPAQSLTVSATTLLAPKEARNLYEKGLEAIHHSRPDEAQKDFIDAVRLYPRFAAAWLELGKVFEQRDHVSQARNAYNSAIAADGEYLFPYQQLYRLDTRESKWEEAAAASGKVLRLNPYEFSEAFFINAVANLELKNLDAAERSAREAAKLEGEQAEPRGNYVLGVILWRKGDLDGAAENLKAFLSTPPNGPEWKSAQKMLPEIERQIARRRDRAGK